MRITRIGTGTGSTTCNIPATLNAGDYVISILAGDTDPTTNYINSACIGNTLAHGIRKVLVTNSGNVSLAVFMARIAKSISSKNIYMATGTAGLVSGAAYQVTNLAGATASYSATDYDVTSYDQFTASGGTKSGNVFFLSAGGTVSSIDFYLSKVGNPTDTIYARVIDPEDASVIGTIGSVAATSVSSGGGWVTFSGTSVKLPNRPVWVGLEATGTADNYVRAHKTITDYSETKMVYVAYIPTVAWIIDKTKSFAIQNFTGFRVYADPFDTSSTATGTNAPYDTGLTGTLAQALEAVFAAVGIEEEGDQIGVWSNAANNYAGYNEQSVSNTSGGGGAKAISVSSVGAHTNETTALKGYMSIAAPDWAALIASFKSYISPTSALDTPSEGQDVNDTTPALTFAGTDTYGNPLDYAIQIDTNSSFNSGLTTIASYTPTADNGYPISYGAGRYDMLGQSFQVSSATKVTEVVFKLYRIGTITGKVRASIWTHSGTYGSTGVPDTLLATSSPVLAADIPTGSGTDISFYFDNVTLQSGYYFVVVESESTTDYSTNYIVARCLLNSPTAPGNYSSRSAETGTWTAYANTDLYFKVLNGAPVINVNSINDAGFSCGSESRPFSSESTVTYQVQSALSATTYYWRVKATHDGVLWGDWTTARTFDIVSGTDTNSSTDGYLKGKDDGFDQTPAYVKGKLDTSDTQSAYLLGVLGANDQTPTYLRGSNDAIENTPAFLSGSLDVLEATPAYLAGQADASENQIAYLQGESSLSSSILAFLNGKSSILDNQFVYIRGEAETTENIPAFLRGSLEANDTSPAYTKGQIAASTSVLGYLEGVGGTYPADSSIEAFLKGSSDANSSVPVFLLGSSDLSSSSPAYLIGEIHSVASQDAYLQGQSFAEENIPAFVSGENESIDSTIAFLKGMQDAISAAIAFLQANAIDVSSKPAYLNGMLGSFDATSAYLAGQSSESSDLSAYLLGGISNNKSAYLSGGINVQDFVSGFVKGSVDISDNTLGYIRGQQGSLENVFAYLKGQNYGISAKSAFISGFIAVFDNTPAYLSGEITSFIHAFISAGINPVSSISTFLSGQDTTSDSINAYLCGSSESSDNTLAYIVGSTNIVTSTPFYLQGEINTTNSTPAFLAGQSSLESQITSYISGKLEQLSSKSVYLGGQSYSSDNQAAFLSGQSSTSSSLTAYLVGKTDTSENISAYLNGKLDTSAQCSAYTIGAGDEISSVPAYMLGVIWQYTHPVSDDAQTGTWRNELGETILYASLDEHETPNDNDYVWQPNPQLESAFSVKLEPTSFNVGEGPVTLRIRAKELPLGTRYLYFGLFEGTTYIFGHIIDASENYGTFEYTMTQIQKESISNWDNLYVLIAIGGT